jgi:hypothetical protein
VTSARDEASVERSVERSFEALRSAGDDWGVSFCLKEQHATDGVTPSMFELRRTSPFRAAGPRVRANVDTLLARARDLGIE